MIDLGPYIEDVARKLLGEPNRALSKRHELRFGNKGSISVKIGGHRHAGTWHDFENQVGGGVWDLLDIAAITGFDQVKAWFQATLGVDIDDHKFDRTKPKPEAPREIVYDYVNEASELVFRVHRGRDKRFWQTQPGPDRGGIKRDPQTDKPTMKGVKLVPYHLDELALAAKANANGHGWRVFIVEGEKDADRLREDWLVPATTNPGGAGKWRKDYAQYFAGADAVLIADNDQAGREHMAEVAKAIAKVATRVRMLDLAVPDKGDISDWMDAGGTQSDLEDLIDGTEDFKLAVVATNGTNGHRSWITRSGEILVTTKAAPQPWFWEQWFPRGQCSLFYGHKGIRKSTFMLQAMVAGAAGGYFCGDKIEQCQVYGLFVEDGLNAVHLRFEEIIDYYRRYHSSIDACMKYNFHFASLVGVIDTEFVQFKFGELETTASFEKFHGELAKIRPRLVVLDTVTDFYGGNDLQRRDVARFFRFMDSAAMEFDCAIVLLGHPSLQRLVDDKNLGAGSTSWEHKARAVVGLRAGKPEEGEEEPLPTWRILRRQRSNYAKEDEEIRLIFGDRVDDAGNKDPAGHPGVFWKPAVKVAGVLQKIDCRRKFVELLRAAPSGVFYSDTKQGQHYAPRRFAQICHDFTERDFEKAMDDLIYTRPPQIEITETRFCGRRYRHLAESDQKGGSTINPNDDTIEDNSTGEMR